ncbi:unnamed protein product [Rotaria sordida]|uniref:Protein kinase domain-containing protein n=1 Tax=Rotaria sordida TaxID=392033 RepID=A0A814JHT2_9BILA|nr:unnamed protein product [Rotaria sordida]
MKKIASNEDSVSDFESSIISNMNVNNVNRPNVGKRTRKSKDSLQNLQTNHESKSNKKTNSLSSNESHTSYESASTMTSKTYSSTLSSKQIKEFRQCIENEYDVLQRNEVSYFYYINDQSAILRARRQLEQATNGTFFVRPAEENERTSNIEYFLDFVAHKQIVEVPICCDKEHRTFWFLTGCGHGSEVRRVYTGIDILIQHKQENHFYELQYPFRICLYRPIDRTIVTCIPLPDEVRGMTCQKTILHELATQGLVLCFKELIQISKNDLDSLQTKALFIINKINGKNKQGQTPLILAILFKKYDFIDILLDNKVNVNITDTEGCSPLHYTCRQGIPTILKKLIDLNADPHYVNSRKTTDASYESNLSAFHYLAMSKGTTQKNLIRCAKYLLQCGCSLMPLTHNGKTPFDIAKIYNNNAYECIKIFCNKYQFNQLHPMEVSSRNDAKTILTDLTCPNTFGKVRLRLKKYDNSYCFKSEGLFLLYQIKKKTKIEPNGELGLCVHHNRQIYIYPISQRHNYSITYPSNSTRKILYKFSLITDTAQDDQTQVILFKSPDELIYNHTKYKGILPTLLRNFVRKENNEMITIDAQTLILPSDQSGLITDDEEPDIENEEITTNTVEDINSINRIDLFQIQSAKILDENEKRLIWLAKIRLDHTILFPIIIKDYLPKKNIDLYKEYRLKELNNLSQNEIIISNNEFSFEYNSRTHHEYDHESKILLQQFKNYPLIIHTFLCDHNLERDLRLFIEYLPMGNLHSYLKKLDPHSLDPLINGFHWIYQLSQVMAFLSNNKIVHRDLATRNILLQNEKYIKLSDFGLSRCEGLKLEKNDCIVPIRWSAPECFDRTQIVSSLSDVWSFGIVIWEIYSFGAIPYETDIHTNSQQSIYLLKRFLIEQGRRLSRPERCSKSIYDLMYRCWNGNITKRPYFVDIIDELNGTNVRNNCIIPFTHEERKAWKIAKDEYLNIHKSIQITSTIENPYIELDNNENEDTILL